MNLRLGQPMPCEGNWVVSQKLHRELKKEKTSVLLLLYYIFNPFAGSSNYSIIIVFTVQEKKNMKK